jgi:hypothetical protein
LETFPNDCATLWSKITDARNDINHAGMRESPNPAKSLNDIVLNICKQTIELINAYKSIKSPG